MDIETVELESDDQLSLIFDTLLLDDVIKKEVTRSRIKFYIYPATGDVNGAYIVIDPLMFPLPSAFGDNETLAVTHLYQIDVWTKTRKQKDVITKKVIDVMKSIGYGTVSGGVDEYDAPTGIYRTAIRYRKAIEKT